MVDIAREQEVWKQYPDYPFVEVSNLGRARTKDRYVTVKGQSKRLIKGRILKQEDNGRGYMQVKFCMNGKLVHLLVHRAVAICFIPNPNNYSEVNHKDNDKTNNVVSNLEWCTSQYNIAYRENYGVSARKATKALRRPVFAVGLKTGKVLRFESRREAERQLNIPNQEICKVVKGKQYTAGGYWFTEDKNEITENKIQEIRASVRFLGGVITINLDTFEVLYFESQHEAARQLGVSQGNISSVIKGKQNKTGDFWFCNADENVVEKTRVKFGDDVARKVEKLMRENELKLML